MTHQKNNQISEFNARYWMLFFFISLIYVAIGNRFWDKSTEIVSVLDALKLSNVGIQDWIRGHWEVILTTVSLYVMALAYWKFKKGIFSESEIKGKFWSGILLHRIFSLALLVPFMLYLCHKTLPNEHWWLWTILYFSFYVIASSLLEISSEHQEAALDRRWVVWILLFLSFLVVLASLKLNGFWEAAAILFVSWVAFPASNALLKSYTISISSYEAIEKVHSIQSEYYKSIKNGSITKKILDFFFDEDGKSVENPVSLPFAFRILEDLGNMSLIAAFGFIYIWWSYDLNVITIGYVHITLVLCSMHLWLIANKFPAKVDIRVDRKWRRDIYLVEKSENQVIVMDKKGKSIFRPDDVLEIRFKNTNFK